MKLLTYKEVAQMLRLHPVTVRKKVAAGAIPYLKPFGRRGPTRFDAADIERLLEQSRRGGDLENIS